MKRLISYFELRHWYRLILSLLLWLGIGLGYPTSATAENASPETSSPSVEQLAPNHSVLDADAISPEKVSQFVRAYLQVVSWVEQQEGELQAAETDSESVRVQQEIEAEALGLIEAEGLTLQEYMQLLTLANLDPEFGDRIALQLQEAID
jgi:ABC-type nitrate/sulfonate/bicarbonate transport system substrate-binding protein